MKNALMKFVRDERGATAIEYGMIAGLMAVVIVAGFSGTGSIAANLKSAFTYIALKLALVV